jgi:hypothetical protein
MAKRCTICHDSKPSCVKKILFRSWYNLAFNDKDQADISPLEEEGITPIDIHETSDLFNDIYILDGLVPEEQIAVMDLELYTEFEF